MGGFAVQHRRDPPYSVCGCSNTQTVCHTSFTSLQKCGPGSSSRPIYVVPLLSQSGVCPAESNKSADGDIGDGVMVGGCDLVEFEPGYEVDGLSADLLHSSGANMTGRGCECGDGEGEPMVSAHYYQESENTLSVTVWYNNRVSGNTCTTFTLFFTQFKVYIIVHFYYY